MDRTTKYLTPGNCRFFLTDTGLLRAEIDSDTEYARVTLRRLFPIHKPDEFIAVRENGGDELGIIQDLSAFDRKTRREIEKELDLYYSLPVITEINAIESEFGFTLWDVETTRGPHEFHIKGRSDSIAHGGENELFITDIHNCRYHIPDTTKLSPNSRSILEHAM